jgi:hypothetical protein
MTNSQLVIILANIWIVKSCKDEKFVFAAGLFYLIVYIILGILGK